MARHDYIFVDESGDAAFTHDPVSRQLSSSRLYIAAALHLCDDSFRDLNMHMAAFRYYSGLSRELKIPAGREELPGSSIQFGPWQKEARTYGPR